MKKLKVLLQIVGIIIGIITIIVANNEFDFSYNGTVAKEKYGGDAYTGIQQATAQTSTNTYNIYSTMQDGFRMFFTVSGALIILHYSIKLNETLQQKGQE